MPKRFFFRGLVKQLFLMLTLTHVLRVRGPSICAAVSNNNLYYVSSAVAIFTVGIMNPTSRDFLDAVML